MGHLFTKLGRRERARRAGILFGRVRLPQKRAPPVGSHRDRGIRLGIRPDHHLDDLSPARVDTHRARAGDRWARPRADSSGDPGGYSLAFDQGDVRRARAVAGGLRQRNRVIDREPRRRPSAMGAYRTAGLCLSVVGRARVPRRSDRAGLRGSHPVARGPW
jgi:hypothetical protein